MALKLGTENKRNVIIVCVLFVVAAIMGVYELTSGPSTPPPAPAAPAPVAHGAHETRRTNATAAAPAPTTAGPAAQKLSLATLDPSLHLAKLAESESIEYTGSGRNIFSPNSAPVVAIEKPKAPIRVAQQAKPTGPIVPPVPQPPAIDLKYFGYLAPKTGAKQAFLKHGDDIFLAAEGEIVNHRYRVMTVHPTTVEIMDLAYNHSQTIAISD